MQSPRGDHPDFLGALAAKRRQGLVVIAGKPHAIDRGRLRLHYELQEIAADQSRQPSDRVRAYLTAASGLPVTDLQPDEYGPALDALLALNKPIQVPAILRAAASRGGPSHKPPLALQYPGRWLAAIVNMLAHAYGWTSEYILEELGPEEAWLYVQEATYQEYQDQAFHYGLSTVGRDKRGKQKPLTKPQWIGIGYPDLEAEKAKHAPPVPEHFKPAGTVISLVPRAAEKAS